jgi:hypothetical protein
MDSVIEKIQEVINSEVQKKLNKFAQLVSKRHDISLKLLLQDLSSLDGAEEETVTEPVKSSQCLGITGAKKRCKFSGKHGGYCTRHLDQKKVLKKVASENLEAVTKHVGHTLTDCMFLAGCPACEKVKNTSCQNLLIDI